MIKFVCDRSHPTSTDDPEDFKPELPAVARVIKNVIGARPEDLCEVCLSTLFGDWIMGRNKLNSNRPEFRLIPIEKLTKQVTEILKEEV